MMRFLTKINRVTLARLGFLGVFLLVVLLLWVAVLSPRFSQAAEITAQANDVELKNLALVNQLNQTRTMLEEAPAAAKEAQSVLAQMPQTADLPGLLDQITAATVDAGIDPNQVSSIATGIPAPVAESAGIPPGVQLAQMSLTLSAQGSQKSIAEFLDNLQSLDRSLLITSTQVARPSEATPSNDVALQVAGTMFVLQSALPDLVSQVDTLLADKPAG